VHGGKLLPEACFPPPNSADTPVPGAP
jgi:hypothetical protein